MEFESFKGTKAVVSESVYQFLRGCCWGAVWGMVTPIYPSSSIEAKREASSGIFKPAPPFKSLRSVPSNALAFGALLGIQRFGCRSMELIRLKQDEWNDAFGVACIFPYYRLFMNTERRFIVHNRAVGSVVVLAVLYANVIA